MSTSPTAPSPASHRVLISRRVLLPDGIRPACVVVADGRITSVQATAPAGLPVEDLGDLLLMPALTDSHVHVNEPGRTEWEGFSTATRAAAAGGVTLLVDMPLNSDPVTTSRDALARKLAAADGKLWIDTAFWGGVVPGNADELPGMADDGVLGFKCFLCHSGIDDFPASTERDLVQAMPRLRDAGVPLLVHAELESQLRAAPRDASPRSYARYLHSRPKEWEDRAVAMVIDLVERTGCRAHIVHLSSAGSLPLLRKAKARGLPITAETCPHYLGLAAEDVPDGATAFKCAPPIRERDNQALLWQGLADGVIDFVVTDHSPCLPALKLPEQGDFMAAWGGISSLQLGLRSVWTHARRRGFDMQRVARWMCTGPAAFLGLSDRGRIAPGCVADLVAFDAECSSCLLPEQLLHRHPTSPWAGQQLAGEVVTTWLRGAPIHHRGVVADTPSGRIHLGPTAASPPHGAPS